MSTTAAFPRPLQPTSPGPPESLQQQQRPQHDFLFKLLIIGESATDCDNTAHTIGVEFGSKFLTIGRHRIKLQIWDSAGQERFRSVTRNYYRGAAGALLVYDIANRHTFNVMASWITEARSLAGPDLVIVLVGNKLDQQATRRQVPYAEASRFAQENDLIFLEASAAAGDNVHEAFTNCAQRILTKIETGLLDPEKVGSGIQYYHHDDAIIPRLLQSRAPRRGCCS